VWSQSGNWRKMSFKEANRENKALENASNNGARLFALEVYLQVKNPSNGQNELEPKTLGLGFAKSLAMLTKIRYKYD